MNSPVPERTAFVPPHETSIAQQPALVKPFWTNLLGPSWVVALVIFAIVASVRFFVFLGPYSLQELLFLQIVGLWTLPFVLLTDRGRRQIGLTAAGTTAGPLLGGAVTGAVCGFLLFKLGTEIYGNSPNNWDLSIRSYLRFDEMRGLLSPAELFALYAFPAVFVNPAGEEILFRGLIRALRHALSVSSRDLARRIGISSPPRLRRIGHRSALTYRFHVPSVPCPFRFALGRDDSPCRLQPGAADGSDSSVRSLS
jgi:hypothetical protein